MTLGQVWGGRVGRNILLKHTLGPFKACKRQEATSLLSAWVKGMIKFPTVYSAVTPFQTISSIPWSTGESVRPANNETVAASAISFWPSFHTCHAKTIIYVGDNIQRRFDQRCWYLRFVCFPWVLPGTSSFNDDEVDESRHSIAWHVVLDL